MSQMIHISVSMVSNWKLNECVYLWSGGYWNSWAIRPTRKKRWTGMTNISGTNTISYIVQYASVYLCMSQCHQACSLCFPGWHRTFRGPRGPRKRGTSRSKGICRVAITQTLLCTESVSKSEIKVIFFVYVGWPWFRWGCRTQRNSGRERWKGEFLTSTSLIVLKVTLW